MNNQEAINILGQYDVSNIHFYTTDGEEIPFTEWSDAIEMAISALQAQEAKNSNESSLTQNGLDTISRQDAIDEIRKCRFVVDAIEKIIGLPSAQPEPSEITDEQAILHLQSTGWMQNHDREMYESGLREQLADDSGSYDSLIPCEDAISRTAAIDALNDSIKHFDDMAEECRRNANIERNDYMDMRDDAAEYRQLSIWLNELKWLRERFQSQPEIIHCRDCRYSIDFYQDGCCYCKRPSKEMRYIEEGYGFYCAGAERRTDD